MRNHPASQHLKSASPRLWRRLLSSVWLRAALLALLVGLVGLVPLMLGSEESLKSDGPKEPREVKALVRDPRCPRGTLEDGGACVPVPSVPSAPSVPSP